MYTFDSLFSLLGQKCYSYNDLQLILCLPIRHEKNFYSPQTRDSVVANGGGLNVSITNYFHFKYLIPILKHSIIKISNRKVYPQLFWSDFFPRKMSFSVKSWAYLCKFQTFNQWSLQTSKSSCWFFFFKYYWEKWKVTEVGWSLEVEVWTRIVKASVTFDVLWNECKVYPSTKERKKQQLTMCVTEGVPLEWMYTTL